MTEENDRVAGSGVEPWLSVDEVAAHFGVSRDTIYNWINGRNLPTTRIGKLWKFKLSEVEDWAKSGRAADDPASGEKL